MQLSHLQQQALQVHPDIAGSSSRAARPPDNNHPQDVEDEANAYFQAVS